MRSFLFAFQESIQNHNFLFLNLQGLLSVLACCLSAAFALPYPYPVAFPDDPYHPPPVHKPIVHGYGKPDIGRVKIQVRSI